MIKIASGLESAEMGLLQSQLETEGIACEIRNNALGTIWGTAPFSSELWVLHDADAEPAQILVAAFLQPAPTEAKTDGAT